MFHLDTAHAALSKNGVPLDPLPLMPKLAYLAPELVLGAGGNGVSAGEPTPASDVFSLGAMFFERRGAEVVGDSGALADRGGVPRCAGQGGRRDEYGCGDEREGVGGCGGDGADAKRVRGGSVRPTGRRRAQIRGIFQR